MNEQNKKTEKPDFFSMFLQKHMEILFRVTIYTLVPLFILGSGGYYLDKIYQKSPLFFASSIIISFIVTQISIYITFTSITRSKK